MTKKDTVTWIQVNNWVPIIVSVVSVTIAFLNLKNEVALVRQELAHVSKQQSVMIDLFVSVEQRYGELALKVERLETLSNLE